MRNEMLHKVVDHAFNVEDAREYNQSWWVCPINDEDAYKYSWCNIPEMTITEQGITISDDGTICKTAACIAGHALMMFAPVGTRIMASKEQIMLPGESMPREIDDYVAELLGISDEAKSYLFDAARTKDEIRKAVEDIDNGEAVNCS
jgi:hypothetical protein